MTGVPRRGGGRGGGGGGSVCASVAARVSHCSSLRLRRTRFRTLYELPDECSVVVRRGADARRQDSLTPRRGGQGRPSLPRPGQYGSRSAGVRRRRSRCSDSAATVIEFKRKGRAIAVQLGLPLQLNIRTFLPNSCDENDLSDKDNTSQTR